MDVLPPNTPTPRGPEAVLRRLDQVVRRVRWLHLLSGCARVALLVVLGLVAFYAADRLLDLPVVVRALVLLTGLVLLGREIWRRVLKPQIEAPRSLDAARLVEGAIESFEGRLVTALQLPPGPPGSLAHAVAQQASQACEQTDLRSVLSARPSVHEGLRAAAAGLALFLAVIMVEPYTGTFAQRLLLRDVAWPRDTRLQLVLPERSPVHVVLEDGLVVASRGGILNLHAAWDGKQPQTVELLVEGADEERTALMAYGSGEQFHGHMSVQAGDKSLAVRGGDDDGADTRRLLQVIEPPRLDEPEFVLQPPAYLGEPSRRVGSEDLVVAEGTRVRLEGRAHGRADRAELLLTGQEQPIVLESVTDDQGQLFTGEFVAEQSDSFRVVLAGAHGLSTPDPSHHTLLVHKDRPPALRIYSPARSDVKVTARALVPFGVVAEDDHGVRAVSLEPKGGSPIAFEADVARPTQHRFVLDLAQLDLESWGLSGTLSYAIEASDGRDLPGRGPQSARVEGRRVDIVEDSEVQRLLADRQLRLKEAFGAIRERQQRASEMVRDLVAEPPPADHPDLVAAASAQNQVTTRLQREARELCAILDETITNRLDPGPGAEAVLDRRVQDWQSQSVDDVFVADAWSTLAVEYGEGSYGRLDLVGRLLDMAGMALALSEDLSPAAHGQLVAARTRPEAKVLESVASAQAQVAGMLDRLLDRMDEWEDYQEVLSLVKMLIDDQQSLRQRTQAALRSESGQN